MGEDKGLMEVSGKPMIQHSIDCLLPLVDQLFIVANNKAYKNFGYPVYEDLMKDMGPLAGLYTGLNYSTTEKNVFLSCDAPFVSKELVQELIKQSENYQVTIPKHQDKTYQLIGVYDKSCAEHFENELQCDQRKIRIAIDKLNLNIVNADQFDSEQFMNINTPNEWRTVQ